jgi:DNA-binding GntR family transcriptional regulator
MSQMLQIYRQLREMVLSLDLGPGERLTERWLETRFEGSRTPIRAALIRLEAEELVQRDGRNWMVAPIDLGEIAALAEFREPLETTAARLACTRATDGDLDTVAALLDSCRSDAPREAWHEAGTDFHVELARLSGNPFLLKAVRGVMTRLARARWLEVLTAASREQAWTEHRCILAFIRQRLPNAAAREAAAHVQATRDRLLQSLDGDRRGLRARGFAVIGQHPVGQHPVGPHPVGQDPVGQPPAGQDLIARAGA